MKACVNQRTDPKTERLVITKIAQGIKYQEIYEEVGVPVSTIKKIKKRNLELYYEVKREITLHDAAVAARIHSKAHVLLERRIDAVLAGKEQISTKDLLSLVKEMTVQKQREKEEAEADKRAKQEFENTQELLRGLHQHELDQAAYNKKQTQTLA